jgi:hypothetical protein
MKTKNELGDWQKVVRKLDKVSLEEATRGDAPVVSRRSPRNDHGQTGKDKRQRIRFVSNGQIFATTLGGLTNG